METLAPVELDVADIRRVVEKVGACIVWGGAVRLSPADDVLIRVERPLDIDSEGQVVASILSKKVAAGATHVVIDIPVGATAKVRSAEAAAVMGENLTEVGRAVGLQVLAVPSNGSQPVGRGVGPALEARDVLAVLRGQPAAPADLRERALVLAGRLLEFGGSAAPGEGLARATKVLDDGGAWRRFQEICDAQGGMREPPSSAYKAEMTAPSRGVVTGIDNRILARVAKLAGAPRDPAAGLEMLCRLGDTIEVGQPLFVIHAQSPGELAYAQGYARAHAAVVRVE
jgi:thymidine phosphorylase